MKIAVIMIVRNEADRFLERALETAHRVIGNTGIIRITDDASTDDTVKMIYAASAREGDTKVLRTQESLFWKHEGHARQRHWEWATSELEVGDWVLSLDADETINRPERLGEYISLAEEDNCGWVSLPLYEFWKPTHHRVDGYWFGSAAMRLFKWLPGGQIPPREMACGSEPSYVRPMMGFYQSEVHLLHWGYMREADRVRKHKQYTERSGGHGHLNAHVESIVSKPTISKYTHW